ncbi:hypothetical protein RHS01_01218 [Rhizoctonia solani]|uniref:Uncharacterized protein n=2 Tax=Rhizoctonia solani TaxID=456999 RepID=A0A8H7INV5_9AGAM|nr:hypothetical protein RHS01_01218 [Rhizoctonia solani]
MSVDGSSEGLGAPEPCKLDTETRLYSPFGLGTSVDFHYNYHYRMCLYDDKRNSILNIIDGWSTMYITEENVKGFGEPLVVTKGWISSRKLVDMIVAAGAALLHGEIDIEAAAHLQHEFDYYQGEKSGKGIFAKGRKQLTRSEKAEKAKVKKDATREVYHEPVRRVSEERSGEELINATVQYGYDERLYSLLAPAVKNAVLEPGSREIIPRTTHLTPLMSTVTNARHRSTNGVKTRRRRLLGPAISVVMSTIQIIGVPGLTELGSIVRKTASALKARGRISREIERQVNRIEHFVATLTTSVNACINACDDDGEFKVLGNYLYKAQESVDELNKLRHKLIELKHRRYKKRFASQSRIIDKLDAYEKQFSDVISEFHLISSVSANIQVGGLFQIDTIGTNTRTTHQTTRDFTAWWFLGTSKRNSPRKTTASVNQLRVALFLVVTGAFF